MCQYHIILHHFFFLTLTRYNHQNRAHGGTRIQITYTENASIFVPNLLCKNYFRALILWLKLKGIRDSADGSHRGPASPLLKTNVCFSIFFHFMFNMLQISKLLPLMISPSPSLAFHGSHTKYSKKKPTGNPTYFQRVQHGHVLRGSEARDMPKKKASFHSIGGLSRPHNPNISDECFG